MKKVLGHDGLYKDNQGVVHIKKRVPNKNQIIDKKLDDFDKRLEKIENLLFQIANKEEN